MDIQGYKQINFMQSVLSSVDHKEQNEKKQLNYQNQEGLLGHQNCLKQMSENSMNQRNFSGFSADQKLIRFKYLIKEGLL